MASQEEVRAGLQKPAITPEQFFALQRELEQLRQVVARNVDAMPEEPFYECIEPFYSADDVYYPAGARFVDVTGEMVPNEQMIPLNAAAEERMSEYLASLPHAQRTPTLENLVQAAMKVRPREGDDPKLMAEFQSRMLREAIELQHGVSAEHLSPASPRPVPRSRANVPMMPNTRIVGGEPSRGARPGATRFMQEPVAAANKTTRAMGTVQSNPLGTEQAGVTGR